MEYFYKYGTADTLTSDTLTADTLTADTLTAETLTADSLTADTLNAGTLTQEIFNFPDHRQMAVKCKMAITSQQRGWCVLDKMTRCSASGPRDHRTRPFVTFSPLGVHEGQSLCTSTTRNRG